MNKKLYNNILSSIYNEITEQFNVNDLDFTDYDDQDNTTNSIYNKVTVDPFEIYGKILNNMQVEIYDYEIINLNDYVSVVNPKSKEDMYCVIEFYSTFYPNDSLNWLDVSHIIDMSDMFYCTTYNGDISQWNVSNVTNMNAMFQSSYFNNDISGWDVSHVETMSSMFAKSKFNSDISGWDVSHVEAMSFMFHKSVFDKNISGWDVSNVKNMQYMFAESAFTGDISQWDVSNVQTYTGIFKKSKIPTSCMPEIFK